MAQSPLNRAVTLGALGLALLSSPAALAADAEGWEIPPIHVSAEVRALPLADRQYLYRARRLVVYHWVTRGKHSVVAWGTMRGDRDWVGADEFNRLVDAGQGGERATRQLETSKLLWRAALGVSAGLFIGGVATVTAPFDTTVEAPREPDVPQHLAPAAWDAWREQVAVVSAERDRREHAAETIDSRGVSLITIGVLAGIAGAAGLYVVTSGRQAYGQAIPQEDTERLTVEFNRALAAELGLEDKEALLLDELKPRRKYRLKRQFRRMEGVP